MHEGLGYALRLDRLADTGPDSDLSHAHTDHQDVRGVEEISDVFSGRRVGAEGIAESLWCLKAHGIPPPLGGSALPAKIAQRLLRFASAKRLIIG